jgi:hypothetical protein
LSHFGWRLLLNNCYHLWLLSLFFALLLSLNYQITRLLSVFSSLFNILLYSFLVEKTSSRLPCRVWRHPWPPIRHHSLLNVHLVLPHKVSLPRKCHIKSLNSISYQILFNFEI